MTGLVAGVPSTGGNRNKHKHQPKLIGQRGRLEVKTGSRLPLCTITARQVSMAKSTKLRRIKLYKVGCDGCDFYYCPIANINLPSFSLKHVAKIVATAHCPILPREMIIHTRAS